MDEAHATRLRREPHGTTVGHAPAAPDGRARRVLERDRHGTLLAALRWADDGRLDGAWIRLPDRAWLAIEPRATTDTPWGLADRLWRVEEAALGRLEGPGPLTVFEALDYAAVDRIPTLLDPTRLPPGGGAAVLNLIAALASDGACGPLAYRGPYPTEHLFLALLQSFRPIGPTGGAPEGDLLAAFAAGTLAWAPAPHERVVLDDGLTVQLRQRVETVAWHGRTYHRPDTGGVARHAPRRVRDDGGRVRCSLWALGAPLEDHLVLDREGTLLGVIQPAPPPGDRTPLGATVVRGIVEAAAATSAPALAPFVREAGRDLALAWGPVAGDLVGLGASEAVVSLRFRARLGELLRAAPTAAARAAAGLAALGELSLLLGDVLRARAQARLAALPRDAQMRALGEPGAAAGPETAGAITAAVAGLLEEAPA